MGTLLGPPRRLHPSVSPSGILQLSHLPQPCRHEKDILLEKNEWGPLLKDT